MAYLPVEAKSANVRNLKEVDRFQLMTYCFLLEENGLIVRRGRLRYANTDFYFPFGPVQRQEVLRVLEEMRKAEQVNDLQCFAPAQDGRCRGCEFRTVCS
ncbi:MAG: Dna2/Cas4 domain-containing protein [Thermodesulfobacteriota bacterium]